MQHVEVSVPRRVADEARAHGVGEELACDGDGPGQPDGVFGSTAEEPAGNVMDEGSVRYQRREERDDGLCHAEPGEYL